MIYGLLATLNWGVSTVLAVVAVRRIGTLCTVVLGKVIELVGYLTLFFLGHVRRAGLQPLGDPGQLGRLSVGTAGKIRTSQEANGQSTARAAFRDLTGRTRPVERTRPARPGAEKKSGC